MERFGNLTGRVGTGTAQSTTMSTPADATTNRLSGYSYDANGNQLSTGNVFDAENRLAFANVSGGMVEYFYDAQNKRVWQGTCTAGGNCQQGVVSTDTITLFGADGRLVATYQWSAAWNNTQTQVTVTFQASARRAYFGGKLVSQSQSGVMLSAVQDRLGSVGKYYPYGEERNAPPLNNDQVKFATYTRDSGTGLDYADQRYYASTFGRFMTVDRARSSAGPGDPGSWNRYSYTRGDPVNRADLGGLDDCSVSSSDLCISVTGQTPPPTDTSTPLSSATGIIFDGGYAPYDFDSLTQSGIADALGELQIQMALLMEQMQFQQAKGAFQNAATLIAGTKNWSADCEKDFTALGVTDATIEAGASTAQFLDGVGSSTTMASLYVGAATPLVGQLGALLPGTVGQDIAAHHLGVVADAALGGNSIYLNGPLISGLLNGRYRMTSGVFDVTAITLHEILHNVTGLNDPEIESKLGLSTSDVSDAISQKLRTDCFQ